MTAKNAQSGRSQTILQLSLVHCIGLQSAEDDLRMKTNGSALNTVRGSENCVGSSDVRNSSSDLNTVRTLRASTFSQSKKGGCAEEINHCRRNIILPWSPRNHSITRSLNEILSRSSCSNVSSFIVKFTSIQQMHCYFKISCTSLRLIGAKQ